jgi:hypothetical protein
MLCKCGCGEQTKSITKTNVKQGRVRGRWNDFVWGHNQSFWGKIGEKMNRENLVPATFRERKSWLNEKPRTWEQIQAQEKAAAERKAAADAKRAAEVAAEEAAFQLKKEKAEAESANIRPRKCCN